MCIYNKNSWGFSSRPSKAYGFTDLKIKHLEAGAHTTKNSWGFSSAGRAPALHAGGQEFESPNLHQYISLETIKFQAFLFPYYSAFLLYLKTCLLICYVFMGTNQKTIYRYTFIRKLTHKLTFRNFFNIFFSSFLFFILFLF